MSTLSRLLRDTPRTEQLDRYIKSDLTGHEPPPYVQMMEHAEKLEGDLSAADSLYVAALDLAAQAQRDLAAAQAVGRAYRADAGRYRWLRDGTVKADIDVMRFAFSERQAILIGDELDAAIDAARKP